jgi:hypothetical protein
LLRTEFIEYIQQFRTEHLQASPGVSRKIQSGNQTWLRFVLPSAAAVIQKSEVFGFNARKAMHSHHLIRTSGE